MLDESQYQMMRLDVIEISWVEEKVLPPEEIHAGLLFIETL